jgi:uncharacterized protein
VESEYKRRLIDDDLDELLPELAAIAIEGAKGVGKSVTAARRARTILDFEDETVVAALEAYPARLDSDRPPVLLDEWQRFPRSWDLVRRSVDRNSAGGRFLLTGSATPADSSHHSGAGRIVRLRMRPLSLAERSLVPQTVSLGDMLRGGVRGGDMLGGGVLGGGVAEISGRSTLSLENYVDEILASGFPGIRHLGPRARDLQLDGYLERIVDADFADQGHRIRRPASLRGWLAAYAAATATNASYSTILDAATPGETDKPAKTTAMVYRDVLERLWMLDPVPGWAATNNFATKLAQAPKHHLADPALAARLLGVTKDGLLRNAPVVPKIRDGLLLGCDRRAPTSSPAQRSLRQVSMRTAAQMGLPLSRPPSLACRRSNPG